MRKIMLSALVSTVVLAGVTLANDDLLAEATQGEVKASQSLELSKEEMKDVKGGASLYSSIYASAFRQYMTVTRYMTPMQRLATFTRVNGRSN